MEVDPRLDALLREDRTAREIQARGREFRARYIDPVAQEIDGRLLLDPTFTPHDIIRKACEYRFLSLPIPKFLGGGGMSTVHSAILLEELCAGCAGIANIIGAHYLGLAPVLMSLDLQHFDGCITEVVREERRGNPILFSAAVTEPMAGTDVEDAEFLPGAKLVTFATPVAGGYMLNGRKVFISNGSIARYNVVICATDRQRPVETWSAFIVPAGSDGFSNGRVELKMGQRACHAAELVFENCFIPERNRIGSEGGGAPMTELVLGASRAPVAAIATGIARGAFEKALALSRSVTSGGRKLCERQWVQMTLADMASMVRLARGAYLDAALLFDASVFSALLGRPGIVNPVMKMLGPLRRSALGRSLTSRDMFKRAAVRYVLSKIDRRRSERSLGISSAAKFSCSDLAIQVCLKALEVAGNRGIEERTGIEKCLRDAKLTQIYEGTNQLNRYTVYKTLLGETDH
jgi:alkylation response protein AidB-like acyl-CoA dehydrogenase